MPSNQTYKTFLSVVLASCFYLANGQQEIINITGMIYSSEDHSPLPGATVTLKGLNSWGTVSDQNGKYVIKNVPKDGTLIFSFIGMNSQEFEIKGRTEINVEMTANVTQLESVVIIGYGSVKRSQVTGSVAELNSKDIVKQPVLSAAQAIQGKIPGVQIISSGDPASSPQIRIRGTNSITADANPVYIVDGVIMYDITSINANDISSLTILKDAASQAIYGSRGANGVILVTTKSGSTGKIRVNFDTYVGIRAITSKIRMADSRTYAEYMNEAVVPFPPLYDPDSIEYDTDWIDAITRRGFVQNSSFNVSGGTEKITYYFSASYFRDEGILMGNSYTRSVIRNSNEYRLTKFLKIGHNLNVAVSKNNMKPAGFTYAYRMPPVVPVYNPDGSYGYAASLNLFNPVADNNYTHHFKNETRLEGNGFIELTPVNGLVVRSSFNFNNPLSEETEYVEEYYVYDQQKTNNSELTQTYFHEFNYIFDNHATYAFQLSRLNELTVVAGYSVEHLKNFSLQGVRTGIPNQENLWYLNLGEESNQTNNSYGNLRQRASIYGRFTYTYNNRYNFSGVLRRDGSSVYPTNQKWGTFFSFGTSWIISREEFMRNFKLFNDLKLRGSYGKIGNDNVPGGSNLSELLQLYKDPKGYSFDGVIYPAVTYNQIKGADVSWETTSGIDIGLEFSMLKRRLSGECAFYSKRTNSYANIKVLGDIGDADNLVFSRTANVRNQGYELSLNWNDAIGSENDYNIGVNVTLNNNNVEEVTAGVLELNDGFMPNATYITRTVEGQPVGSFYVLEVTGIWRDQEEIDGAPLKDYLRTGPARIHPGDLKYADINGDSIISDLDKVFAGSYQPKVYFGFNLGFTRKQFDISVDCYGNLGAKIFNAKKFLHAGIEEIEATVAENRWTETNPDGTEPRANTDQMPASTYFIESADFLRINNVTLGYTIPVMNRKVGISKFRVFISAQNPFIVKEYSGLSPEISPLKASEGNATNAGLDYNTYPVYSTYMAGFNISF